MKTHDYITALIAFLEKYHIYIDDYSYGDLDISAIADSPYYNTDIRYDADTLVTIYPFLESLKNVEQHGGEGQGNQCWVIWQVDHSSDGITLLRHNGYYASHDGYEFYNLEQVLPALETRTIYRSVQ